jgi:hypothetical protein
MRRNAARITFACIVGTLFVSVLLLSRTDVDHNLQTHERHELAAFGDFEDPVLHRRKVVEEFKKRHQGIAAGDRRTVSRQGSTVISSDAVRVQGTPQPTVGSVNRSGWSRYFKYAMKGDANQLWPVNEGLEKNDRILNQLHHVHVDPVGTSAGMESSDRLAYRTCNKTCIARCYPHLRPVC